MIGEGVVKEMVQNGNYYVSQREFWDYYYKHRDAKCLINGGGTKDNLFREFVNVVYLELSSSCNRKCSYCPVSIYPRKQKHMDEKLFINLIDMLAELDYRNTISLSLYNEPLLDDKLLVRTQYIHDNLPFSYIRFNSNGDYLDADCIKQLSLSGVKEIQVTAHFLPGEMWNDEVAIGRVQELLGRIKATSDITNFTPGHNVTTDFIYDGVRLLILANNWEADGNSRGGVVTNLNCKNRVAPCSAPFREVAIDVDGNVRQCCNMYVSSAPMFSIRTRDISDIFCAEEMNRLRKELLSFGEKNNTACKTCNTFDYSMNYSANIWNGKWATLIK